MDKVIPIVLVLLPIAILPTIIAIKNNHPHKVPIILVNIVGGILWGIGWVVALVWCFVEPSTKKSADSDESVGQLEKINHVKENGAHIQEGVIVKCFEDKCFGFIESDRNSSIFFHRSNFFESL